MSDLSKHDLYSDVEDRRGISLGGPTSLVGASTWSDPHPPARTRMGEVASALSVSPTGQYRDSGEPSDYVLSARSLSNLEGVDPRLAIMVGTLILTSTYDFIVIEGVRARERQQFLFDTKKSKTLNSRHLTGHAVDLAIWHDGQIKWVPSMYRTLADEMKLVAERHNLPIEWGGDFTGFFDGPHFQIPWRDT